MVLESLPNKTEVLCFDSRRGQWNFFFYLTNHSSRTVTQGFTQRRTKMSTTLKPNLSRLFRKCRILDISQSCGSPGPVTRTASLFLHFQKRRSPKLNLYSCQKRMTASNYFFLNVEVTLRLRVSCYLKCLYGRVLN
jgi:hypothetical protein